MRRLELTLDVSLRRRPLPQRVVIAAQDGVRRRLLFQDDEAVHGTRHLLAGLAAFVGRVDAVTNLVHKPGLFQVSDGMRPDEERELLRHAERWAAPPQPEKPLLNRAHGLDDFDHRTVLAVHARVDDQTLRKQPEAHGEYVTILDNFANFFEINHETVLRKQDGRPFCRTSPGPAVELYRLPGRPGGA